MRQPPKTISGCSSQVLKGNVRVKTTREKDVGAHAKFLEASDKKKFATNSSEPPDDGGSTSAGRTKIGGAASSGYLDPSMSSSFGPAVSPGSTKRQAESQAEPEEVHAPVQQELAGPNSMRGLEVLMW